MRFFCLCALVAIVLFSCEKRTDNKTNLLSKIPNSSEIIITVNNLESLKTAIKNNQLITELGSLKSVKGFERQITPLKFIQTNTPIYIGIDYDKNDSLKLSMVTAQKATIFNYDSIPNLVLESFSYKGQTINTIEIDNKLFYSAIKDSILFLSNRLSGTKGFLSSKQQAHIFSDFFETANPKQTVSIFTKTPLDIMAATADSALREIPFTKNTVLDVNLQQNNIYINGITTADSVETIISCFKGTIPQENKMADICPASTTNFTSFTAQDITTVNNKLHRILKKDTIENNTAFGNIIEFGHAEIKNATIVALRSIDVQMTLEALGMQAADRSYRTIDIHELHNAETLDLERMPLLPKIEPIYYINLDDFIVFSEEISVLKTLISNYQNNNTIARSDVFKDLMLHLNDEASIFMFGDSKFFKNRLQYNFKTDSEINTKAYNVSAVQFISESNFAHVNAAFEIAKQGNKNGKINELFNLSLDAQIISNPQFVKNHITGEMEIVVQDISNKLYLISNKGKVLWKKQLNGAILGKISQMDIYRNRRLQLVFATSNRVYVIDRNGNDVSNFPLKFSDKITQPLSLFDYDNNRNYRLLVTQGKNLLMYDRQGNRVTGFKYKGGNKPIRTQPKHFRIGRKDYIVFSQGNKLEILSRTGKTRINVSDDIIFSDNDIYLYNNSFTTTNQNGELLQTKTNGTIKRRNLNLNEDHKITATNKSLVSLSENLLTIKSKTIELDFGNYTSPKIFYLNDKIYVSVSDLQHKKVHLFDSQGKRLSNFPVYGNSAIDMNDVDNDNKLEVITKGDKTSIILYRLN